MSLLQKFKQFLTDDLKGGALTLDFIITAEERKALIREHLTPVIEKELQMTQVADFIWASEYNGVGMRKVLSFFHINDAYATLKWGWNFEFVPKYSGSKIVWARTDKSIYTHVYEVSKDFYDVGGMNDKKRQARDKVIMSRYYFDEKRSNNVIAKAAKDYRETLKHLLPTIKKYYNATKTLESVLSRIDENLNNEYYSFINPGLAISRAFILYRLNLKEEAIADFEKIPFVSEKIRAQYYKKLLSI